MFDSRLMPRHNGESQERWEYRILVRGFYERRDVLGKRFWLDKWGPRPPIHQSDYIEPIDDERFQLTVRKAMGRSLAGDSA